MKISQTGVGAATHEGVIRDSNGTGLLPIQVEGDDLTNFRIMGRVSPEAPWVEVKSATSNDFLECISWVPYLQLEIITGPGTINLYIGEK